MVYSLNFANGDFKTKQRWNTVTAKFLGGIDKVFEYSPEDIDSSFLNQNEELLKHSKGFGNYFWKPYLVKKALAEIEEGDYLIYADSGTIFLKNVRRIINYMNEKNEDVICFTLPLIERQWTKRDAFVLMECDEPNFSDTVQVTGNFFILKKSPKSISFVEEYLKYCSDHRIISDTPNAMGLNNYPEFNAHRHDQSVLSLLCKKRNILLEGDLSDYGYFPYKYIHNDGYLYDQKSLDDIKTKKFKGTILANRKAHPLIYALKYYVRLFLYRFGIRT
ncbi:hypothetical protein [Zobellia sp. OII3]|uniref:hypothetical protein n=1 Tax=Zobellia sp. OII3 TaxID=2034520 RepID=UPI000F4E166A|nr:hypothetical protein [Zobellia sp. OII3]